MGLKAIVTDTKQYQDHLYIYYESINQSNFICKAHIHKSQFFSEALTSQTTKTF